jgi:hypothetical protein
MSPVLDDMKRQLDEWHLNGACPMGELGQDWVFWLAVYRI